MKEKILSALFSFSGASMCIAAAGFLSALVGMFVDVTSTVSVKWLVFTLWLSISAMAIMVKLIYDLATEGRPPPLFESPIKFIENDQLFLIRFNPSFSSSIVVGCYAVENDVERLAYVAVVHLIQDKFIQIKIHKDMGIFAVPPSTPDALKSIFIKPVVPLSVFN
jgi:hypothetical protein